MKYNNSPIRTLARSTEWQNLYSRAKELRLNLFENISDFSKIQIIFLYFLEIYNSIYTDIAMGDCVMNHDKIKDDMIVDAYLIYKRKNRDKGKGSTKKGKKSNTKGMNSLVFRSKRR